jgi:hypothetical protein
MTRNSVPHRAVATALCRPFSSRIAPLLVALGIGVGGSSLHATPDDGRLKLDAQLLDFNAQAQNPPGLAKTTLTASADDLMTAICAALLDPANTVTAEDLAAGALLEVAGKAREDRNLIAGRVVDAAVRASDSANNAKVAAIVKAVVGVNQGGKILDTAGRRAATRAGLKLATGNDSGRAIAQAALEAIGTTNQAAIESFATGVLKRVGGSTGQVQSFVNGFFGPQQFVTGDRTQFSRSLAKSIVAFNRKAAGEVIGSSVENANDAAIQAAAIAAIDNPFLSVAAAQIAAATAAHLSGMTPTAFAQALSSGRGVTARGRIGAGVIAVAPASETAAIVNAVKGAGNLSATDLAKFGKAIATDLGDTAKITHIASTLKPGISTSAVRILGVSMIQNVVKANPSAAATVFTSLATSAPPSFRFDLADAVSKNNTAVGSIAGAVAQNAGDKVGVAKEFLLRYQKATSGIAERVASLTGDKPAFATALISASGSFTSLAAGIAVGVSVADPANAAEITENVVLKNSTTESQASTIAKAVALAVDVEQIANIGTKLAAAMTATGAGATLKVSQASGVASALAKAIQKKPLVPTSNRLDELGELAASIVAGVLPSTDDANRAQVVTGIGLAVIQSLRSSSAPNNVNLKADRRAAADIAGSIAQTIAISALTDVQKNSLLGATGKLATQLASAVGSKYAQTVKDAIAEVRNLVGSANVIVPGSEPTGANGTATRTGKYETGSVNDPETPKKNI